MHHVHDCTCIMIVATCTCASHMHMCAHAQVHIEEDYGPFDSPSKHNPCMRSRWGPLCKSWGFVIARYMHMHTWRIATVHTCAHMRMLAGGLLHV